MPLRTMSIFDIKNMGYELFNFEYNFPTITIGNIEYTKQKLQDEFEEYWLGYDIGYSTLEEFLWRLKRNWKEKIDILNQKLSIYPNELNLNERLITKNYTNNSNTNFENNTDNKYSDTPNQPMAGVDESGKYLTDRTFIDNNGNNQTDNTGSSQIIESKNSLEKYSQIESKIKNLVYDFIKSFKNLFITDVFIYNIKL